MGTVEVLFDVLKESEESRAPTLAVLYKEVSIGKFLVSWLLKKCAT